MAKSVYYEKVILMKKRKKKRNASPTRSRTEPDIIQDIRFLNPDDEIQFKCECCGECCRNVEFSVMLEPYDLYRIARHLKDTGVTINGVEDVIMEHAELKLLENSDFPIFLMKTQGRRKECIFLKDGRCSIHEAKPRACRIYPLGAWPNETFDGFEYFIASQKQHHFKGSAMQVRDWMDASFDGHSRAVALMDAKATKELAPLLLTLKRAGIDRELMLRPLMMYRYICFDLDMPFIPQFLRNMDWLTQALLNMLGIRQD